MKTILINPNLSGDVSILDMGLTYLATYLNERTNHRAQIVDFTFHRKGWKRFLDESIEDFKPDVIGITCTSLYMQYIVAIARQIKEKFGLPVVCGGYNASLMPEETINIPEIDAVCVGDGEYSFSEYLDAVQAGRSLEGIKGIWAKENGKLIKNPFRELNQNINSLPVPNYDVWKDIDEYLYFNQLLYFIGTRGCPYSCTYCSEYPLKKAVPGKHYRVRNPRNFVHEIKYQWEKYKNRNMKLAHTFDAVFTFNPEWVSEFCDEYKKMGLSDVLPFSCFTRGDALDEGRVRLLAEGGCKIVRIGIEAGNERIRNVIYEKNITNAQFKKSIRLCKQYGMAITGYYMLGGPDEDIRTLQDTFNLAKELDVNRPVFFIYQPLPKTKAVEKLRETGGWIDESRMSRIDCLHHASAVHTKHLSPYNIQVFQYKCFLYFIGKRIFKLLCKQKFRFIMDFIKYFIRARRKRVPLWYTVGYFLICCDENLIT